jgi:hypothetical protein
MRPSHGDIKRLVRGTARASHNRSSLRRIGLACLRIELSAQLTESRQEGPRGPSWIMYDASMP